MKLNWKYTVGWVVWILGFGVLEWRAIKDRDKGDTLSEHVWQTIGQGSDSPSWLNWVLRIVLGGGLVWVTHHFFTGGSLI